MIPLPDPQPRRVTWQADLAAYLARVARLKFRPGSHDCAFFAAGAVEAMTGVDFGEPWRGGYRTLAEGRELLQGVGFEDQIALAAHLFEEVRPNFAQVGDLMVMPSDIDGQGAIGVVQGAGVYVLSPGGLQVVDRMHGERAFTV